MSSRIALASSALLRGLLLYLPLTVLCGALIFALVGFLCGHGLDWAKWGAICSLFLAIVTFPEAVSDLVSVDRFLGWFFTSVFLVQLSAGIGVLVGYRLATILPEEFAFGCLYVGSSAFGTSLVVFGILFGAPADQEDLPPGAAPLSTFDEMKHRANVFGCIRRGPSGKRPGSTWRKGQELFDRQAQSARRGFYERS
jgi:hypothetical protein